MCNTKALAKTESSLKKVLLTISYNGECEELNDRGMLNICKAPTRDMFIFYIRRLSIPAWHLAFCLPL